MKHWITFNEPFGHLAYGFEANAECSFNCSQKETNWTSMRYTKGHHLLLSHAAAAKLYHDKYQVSILDPHDHWADCVVSPSNDGYGRRNKEDC